ncbi:hypothetical protein ACNOYE_24825 [Nannocystaceae bacterium ST9]
MSSSPGRRHEHRFQENEAAQILERAADLQRQASDVRRMSLGELVEAADSAGIEPVHVRRAAAELVMRQARRDRASPWIGGPRTILIELTLEGEIPVPAYEYVIEAVRRHTGELGVASLIGRSLTWVALPVHGRARPGWARTISLTVVPRSGRTRIRIEEKLDQLVQAMFGGLFGGVGAAGSLVPLVPLVAIGGPAMIPLGMGLWLSGVWMLARRIFRQRVAARELELHGALQAIVDIAEDYVERRKA